jgi:hypothetical protein
VVGEIPESTATTFSAGISQGRKDAFPTSAGKG